MPALELAQRLGWQKRVELPCLQEIEKVTLEGHDDTIRPICVAAAVSSSRLAAEWDSGNVGLVRPGSELRDDWKLGDKSVLREWRSWQWEA